jgi:signal transduction histidine kinase
LYFSSVLFGLVAGFIVIMRFRTASQQARNSTRNLNEIVRQREAELHHSYQQLEQMAREQERATERTRILRDMHDGVGAHLSTAIRQLEFGQASRTEVLHTLHDSMDQLKLTIDAMNLPPGDLTALLANLRYRLEPRLKTAGIELLWGVQQVPLLPWLDAAAMRHVQFIVFEVISNALQHARATRLGIELCGTPEGGARLKMTDNGCGFDLHNVKLQGLSSLRSRAKALKVQLHLSSVPGQTVVQISWSLPGQPAALDAGEY